MKVHQHIFEQIIAPENLFAAWEEFRKGKQTRKDVLQFEWQLEQNIFSLHRDLASGTYRHAPYSGFTIQDPKQRRIHRASVRDRVLHHAIFTVLNPIFEPTFIAHSFSCRIGKGTHKAVEALHGWLRQVSGNDMRPCFALKCDVHQFFASVDHGILLAILTKRIRDESAILLFRTIIGSFVSVQEGRLEQRGLPIGNLTSQLFANVYMNEFDQFMKHELRMKHFIRYTDDFVIVAGDKDDLHGLVAPIRWFLQEKLRLHLHPHKVTIRKYCQGIDFLGYILLPRHRLVRTKTTRRIFRKLHEKAVACSAGILPVDKAEQSLQSYLGVLSHADSYRLSQDLRNQYWFWMHSHE